MTAGPKHISEAIKKTYRTSKQAERKELRGGLGTQTWRMGADFDALQRTSAAFVRGRSSDGLKAHRDSYHLQLS